MHGFGVPHTLVPWLHGLALHPSHCAGTGAKHCYVISGISLSATASWVDVLWQGVTAPVSGRAGAYADKLSGQWAQT
jgi:hypothetical protein